MKRNSPFGVGRLMRAAICGLLAATVIPAAASADLAVGGATVTTPSVPVPAPTAPVPAPSVPVTVPTVSTPSVSTSASVSASTNFSTPVVSASVSASADVSASVPSKSVTPTKLKSRKKAQRNAKRGASAAGASAAGASVRTFLSTDTTTAPFNGIRENTCLPEFVVFDGDHAKVTTSTQIQPDGTLRQYIHFHGTGLGASDALGAIKTGSVYSFSDENHVYVFGGPGHVDEYFYHYEKLIRRSETTGALGGDDSYLRVAFRVVNTVMIPDLNRTSFECR
jgi:hypothetical protein